MFHKSRMKTINKPLETKDKLVQGNNQLGSGGGGGRRVGGSGAQIHYRWSQVFIEEERWLWLVLIYFSFKCFIPPTPHLFIHFHPLFSPTTPTLTIPPTPILWIQSSPAGKLPVPFFGPRSLNLKSSWKKKREKIKKKILRVFCMYI